MPFGLLHFFVVIIPVNMDLTMSLGVVFFQFVVCGIFGGVIAVWTIIKAMYYICIKPLLVMNEL